MKRADLEELCGFQTNLISILKLVYFRSLASVAQCAILLQITITSNKYLAHISIKVDSSHLLCHGERI